MEPAGHACQELQGQDTGAGALAAGPEAEGLPQGPAPQAQDAMGSGPLPIETSRGPPGPAAGQGCRAPSSGPKRCPPHSRDGPLDPRGPQSRGTGRSLQAREAKSTRKATSPPTSQQKRPKAQDLARAPPPCSAPSGPAPHHPVPCGSGRGSCHLANLLSTLAQDSPDLGRKKGPPEVPCQLRKKTRTLYHSDQLEELERAFQEDHYPDGDKRREIAQAVGVAPQRIMVWFQNRRAKWRRVEKMAAKGDPESPAGPAPGGGSSAAAQPPPLVPLGSGPGASCQEPPPRAPLESPECLEPDRPPDATRQSEGAHRVASTPPLFSPPPVHRAGLPFPLGVVHTPKVLPLLLDAPGSDQSLRDGPCVSWGPSIAPPSTCSYLEELEPGGHQQGPLAFAPAPQPVPPLLSYLHPFPGPVPNSLTPPPLEDTLFPRPFGPHGGPSQGCFPGPASGQVLLQPPGGSMGPVPWNHPCLPELPLPGPFYAQTLGHHTGAEGYLPDDLFLAPYEQTMNGAPSPGPTALPAGARPLGMGPLPSKAPEGLLAEPQDQLATQDEARGEDKSCLVP